MREVTVKEQKEENLLDVNLEQKADNKNTISANYSLEPNKEYKTLTLSVIEAKNLEIGAVITVTPFGVNNKKNMSGQGMVFGKEYPNNAFNFPNEENVGIKQFEINYDFSMFLLTKQIRIILLKTIKKEQEFLLKLTENIFWTKNISFPSAILIY